MKTYSIPRHIWRALWPALLFLGVQIGIGGAVGIAVTISSGGDPDAAPNFAAENSLLVIFITFVAGLAIFAQLWLKTKKTHITLNTGKPKAVTVAFTFIMFICYSLLASSIIVGTPVLEYFPSTQEVIANLEGAFALQIVTIGLLGPIVEECLVRGVILNRLASWLPVWAAVLISSVIFGALHLNMFQFLNTTILGILFGFVYVRTKTLWIPIFAHIANNMTSLMLGVIVDATGVEFAPGLVGGISAAAAVVCAIMIYRFTRTRLGMEAPGAEALATEAAGSGELSAGTATTEAPATEAFDAEIPVTETITEAEPVAEAPEDEVPADDESSADDESPADK